MEFTSDKISKISKEIEDKVNGKVLFDDFSRGRYSTDASVYQIKPIGVVLPKDTNDVLKIMEYSQQNSIPLLARGGGSSQCGQTVGESIVLDYSKHQNKILELNVEEKYVWVEPGVVLDHLNAYLKPYGKEKALWNNLPIVLHHADHMASRIEYENWKGKSRVTKAFANNPKPYTKKPKISTGNDNASDLFKDLFGETKWFG